MPIYVHLCNECNTQHEFILKVGQSKRKCPSCGKNALEKQISTQFFHDNLSPMSPRKGRGNNGRGRIDPGAGGSEIR